MALTRPDPRMNSSPAITALLEGEIREEDLPIRLTSISNQIADANEARVFGTYYAPTDTPNAPDVGTWNITVSGVNADYVIQTATSTVDPTLRHRRYSMATVWTAWVQLEDRKSTTDTITTALTKLLRVDAPANFTPAEQGQGRANIGADILGGFRNKLINPVWVIGQRATSGTIAAGGSGFVGDRWQIYNSTNQTLTWQLAGSIGSGGEAPRGVRTYLTYGFSVAPTTGAVSLYQRGEGAAILEGGKATSTIYTSFGQPADCYFNLSQQFGVGGSPEENSQGATFTAATGLFKRYSSVFDLATTDGKTFGAGDNLVWSFVMFPRHAANYAITCASIVEGDATAEPDPSARRHPQQEFALCARYYEILEGGFSAYAAGTNVARAGVQFKVPKRIPGTLVQGIPSGGYFVNHIGGNPLVTTASMTINTIYGASFDFVLDNNYLTAGQGCTVSINAGAKLAVDAEII